MGGIAVMFILSLLMVGKGYVLLFVEFVGSAFFSHFLFFFYCLYGCNGWLSSYASVSVSLLDLYLSLSIFYLFIFVSYGL